LSEARDSLPYYYLHAEVFTDAGQEFDGDRVSGDWVVNWEIGVGQQQVNLQTIINDNFVRSWRKGNFKYSFSDLQQVTANYQDLPFDKINAILSSEAKRSAEKLEVIGVKFPVSSLKDWGAWIVLAACGLFLIHLAALSAELRSGKEVKMGTW